MPECCGVNPLRVALNVLSLVQRLIANPFAPDAARPPPKRMNPSQFRLREEVRDGFWW